MKRCTRLRRGCNLRDSKYGKYRQKPVKICKTFALGLTCRGTTVDASLVQFYYIYLCFRSLPERLRREALDVTRPKVSRDAATESKVTRLMNGRFSADLIPPILQRDLVTSWNGLKP